MKDLYRRKLIVKKRDIATREEKTTKTDRRNKT